MNKQSFSKFILNCGLLKAAAILMLIHTAVIVSYAQSFDRLERAKAKDMLNAVKSEIKDKYYDPTFRGIDIDAQFKKAQDKIDKAASIGQAFGIIAQAVLELNDSHTTFYPPERAATFEYGWRMQMFADKCFVTAVKPKSDAEKQGLKVGDEILAIENFRPNRKELWKINYYYNLLSPRTGLNIKVQSPGEKQPRELNISSQIRKMKAVLNFEDLLREFALNDGKGVEHRFVTIGNTVIWKMPSFVIEPDSIDTIMQGRVKQGGNLILDLRNNGGGYVVALERLAGYFVDKDTKIADLKGRREMKPQTAKTKGKDAYRGKLIVLIDSNSGSASEIFARFMQIEQRGVVIGDQSSGAVMQSRGVPMKLGADSIIPYGMNMTNADVIMTDGQSLEHIGVTPQVLLSPTAEDMSLMRDPVLAASLQLFGQNISPADAGKLFPYKWIED